MRVVIVKNRIGHFGVLHGDCMGYRSSRRAPSLMPSSDRKVHLFFLTQAAAPPENVLLELSHRLDLMLLLISDEVPLFLPKGPHPKTPELRQLGIGEHIGDDQKQRATAWTTPFFLRAKSRSQYGQW
jgi:hypothetical protein